MDGRDNGGESSSGASPGTEEHAARTRSATAAMARNGERQSHQQVLAQASTAMRTAQTLLHIEAQAAARGGSRGRKRKERTHDARTDAHTTGASPVEEKAIPDASFLKSDREAEPEAAVRAAIAEVFVRERRDALPLQLVHDAARGAAGLLSEGEIHALLERMQDDNQIFLHDGVAHLI